MSTQRKPLIIAEKPSAARAIAEALGGFAKREGYLESNEYYLSWAIGHLVELMNPEEYDARWKKWSLESLPIMPGLFHLKVVSKTKAQFDVLARLGRQAPYLVNACDAAREGELIFRYICQAARLTQPAQRLWVSALTREAIRKAWSDLRSEQEYERLYQSALCRAQGDWLVGMNATRAFTVKWGELFSVGRVQTPTLALLVRRERDIAAFVPEEYWEVMAEFATAGAGLKYKGKWFDQRGDRLKQAEEAQAVLARVKGQPGVVESSEEKPATERPPQLFDLTSLQREANKQFGFTAAATLKAAQSLYEAKLITYPRTDSRYLNRDLVKGLPQVVRSLAAVPEFAKVAAGADVSLVHPGNRRVVDDTKVTDHHAIIPTAETPSGMGAAESKIYGLIARRFLAQFYPDAKYLDTEVITRVGAHPDRFRSRGRRVLDPGWRAVEPQWSPPAKKGEDGETEEERTPLPALRSGEPVATKKAEVLQKQTQPPRRFTEAALLAAMETAGREMDDEALKEAMKGRGLGTPATRAATIERLKDVGYIEVQKKNLVPTAKGHRLVALAEAAGAQVLLSAELTGEWEKHIADIQAGSYQPETFHREIKGLTLQVVELVKKAAGAPAGGEAAVSGAAPAAVAAAGKTGRRSTRARAGGDETAEATGTATAAGAAALPAYAARCPRCGRNVVKGTRDWRCTSDDCAVRVPTWLCGKVIDADTVAKLLVKGRSALITGFKSPRTGKTFSAYLVLKEGQVGFEFPPDKPAKKASGYRRSNTGGTGSEPQATTEAGSRTTRSRSTAGRTGSKQTTGGAGVGGRSPRASKPAGTRAPRD